MKYLNAITLFVLILSLASCAMPSLHSILDNEHQVFDDRIIGQWVDLEEVKTISDMEFALTSDSDPDADTSAIKMNALDSVFKTLEFQVTLERAANITWHFKNSEAHGLQKFTIHGVRESIKDSVEILLKELGNDSSAKQLDSIEIKTLPYYILSQINTASQWADSDNFTFSTDVLGMITAFIEKPKSIEDVQRIKSIEEQLKSDIRVDLTNIGNQLFLNFTPLRMNDIVENYGQLFGGNFISGHSFAKLNFVDGTPVFQMLNGNYIEKLIKERRIRLKHDTIDEMDIDGNIYSKIIITASTQELRAFLEKYKDDDKLFDEPSHLMKYSK